MLEKTYTFTRPGHPEQWSVRIRDRVRPLERTFTLLRNGESLNEQTHPIADEAMSGSRRIAFPEHGMAIEYGPIDLMRYGLVVHEGERVIWRSTDKPFRKPGRLDETIARWEAQGEAAPTPERTAFQARQKALRPSLYVDFAFGILFVFVAREFGLVTAALTGAGATVVLFLVNPFVKWDLLGGFAAFGAAMALISAGLAWGFQDDLAIKLRGTAMAGIGMAAALFDAVVLKGDYLGRRLAMYMEGLGRIDPRRASFALAGATGLIALIDTPLAFLLTTDQWIWYNAFLDSVIAIPIIIGAMLLAREPQPGARP
ncbi:MAG: hypothetical protein WBF53_00510 [Litorimonas sp.]